MSRSLNPGAAGEALRPSQSGSTTQTTPLHRRVPKGKSWVRSVAVSTLALFSAACTSYPELVVPPSETQDGGTDASVGPSLAGSLGLRMDASAACASPTCEELHANCGPVTDPVCGGVVQCGTCPGGQTCGAAGPNLCGTPTCTPESCQEAGAECGPMSDGCGSVVNCGSCTAPRVCGGGGQPGRCGCTGICAQVAHCQPGAQSTLHGTVFDPAGQNPLPNALVYVPNTSDPLPPFPAPSCDPCGAPAAGDPVVSTHTGADGTFTLQNVPVGSAIPLVVQIGRWRRQFKVAVPNACAANAVPDGVLRMPRAAAEGDIPRIALVTGAVDRMECVLRRMGIDDSEFTNPSGSGRVHFYLGNGDNPPFGFGARINDQTPGQDGLFAGNPPALSGYDMVILSCQGHPFDQTSGEVSRLRDYADGGGRVFASHYSYMWLQDGAEFQNVATWNLDQPHPPDPVQATVNASIPKGQDLGVWLQLVGSTVAENEVSITAPRQDTDGVLPPAQNWLTWSKQGTPIPLYFTFDTPVQAQPSAQCGRVLFSDFHVNDATNHSSQGESFPSECDPGGMSAQEKLLEYMLFDLGSCVESYAAHCNPRSCADLGLECGMAGDGCGKEIGCGACPEGETCGAAGPGKCGVAGCKPMTCSEQGVECGAAGDGCGRELDCGVCPGEGLCGGAGPGKCQRVY